MKEEYRQMLNKNRDRFVSELHISEVLLNNLAAKKIITTENREEIQVSFFLNFKQFNMMKCFYWW